MPLQKITDSQFYMWRTVFALAHADNVVTDEEVRYLAEILEDIPFTSEQEAILNIDIKEPQDIFEMFLKVTDPQDQALFFKFAQEIVWIDGEYGAEEQDIMLRLQKLHVSEIDLDEMIGKVDLQLDEDYNPVCAEQEKRSRAKNIIFSFRDQFMRKFKS